MSGSVRSCCVPGCGKTRADNVVLHAFPDPGKETARFITWMNAVGNSISSLDYDFIYKNRKICHDHFEERYLTWTRRLSHIAIPTIRMPGYQVEDVIMRNVTNLAHEVENPIASSSSAGNRIVMEPRLSGQTKNSQILIMVDRKLRSILSSQQFCGLCLEAADSMWSTHVTFEINIHGQVHRKIFKDIICDVFHDVSCIPASSNICKQCTDKTLESYIFRQKTKETAKTLDCYVNCLYNKTVSIQGKLDPFQNYTDKKCTIVFLTRYRKKHDVVNHKENNLKSPIKEDKEIAFNLTEKETNNMDLDNECIESQGNIKNSTKRNSDMTDSDCDDKLVYDDSDYIPDVVGIGDKSNTPKKKPKILRKKNNEDTIRKEDENNYCKQGQENIKNHTKGSRDLGDSDLDDKLIYDDSDFTPDDNGDKSGTVPKKKTRKNEKEKIRGLNKDTNEVVTKMKPIKTDNNEYKCVDCNKVFSLYREWKKHSHDKHPQGLSKNKTMRPSCEVCLKSFSSNKYLLTHYKVVHHRVKCKFCDAYFADSKLQEHLKINHNDFTHSCDYCDLVFHSEITLEDHLNSNHNCEGTNDINGKQCKMCLKYFNEEQLQSHPCRFKCLLCPKELCLHEKYLISFRDQVFKESKKIQCPDCDYVCRKKENFIEHANNEHLNFRPYTCNVCSEKFFSSSDYRSHLKSHNDKDNDDVETKFACEICNKQFDERRKLVWHNRKHKRAQQNKIKCTICSKEMFESNLSMHMKIHDGIESHSFTCETCGKSFAFKVRLDQHKMTHSDPIPCTLCGQLIKPMSMYLHLRRHKIRLNPALKKKPPKKPHNKKCEYCDYTTYCKDLLEIHVNKEHLKVKPHACKDCGASYMSKYYLNQHMRVHKEEKKFNCSVCNKSLRHKIGLKKHMMLHTGERPHICEICGQGYKTVTMLKYHMQKHSGKNEQCPLCGGMYYSIKHVRSHIKKCHWEFKDRKFDYKQVRGLTKEHYHIFQDRRKAIADDIYDDDD